MNLKMMIAAVFVVVALLLGSAQAGCDQLGPYGCCYCHETEGEIIESGNYYRTTSVAASMTRTFKHSMECASPRGEIQEIQEEMLAIFGDAGGDKYSVSEEKLRK